MLDEINEFVTHIYERNIGKSVISLKKSRKNIGARSQHITYTYLALLECVQMREEKGKIFFKQIHLKRYLRYVFVFIHCLALGSDSSLYLSSVEGEKSV